MASRRSIAAGLLVLYSLAIPICGLPAPAPALVPRQDDWPSFGGSSESSLGFSDSSHSKRSELEPLLAPRQDDGTSGFFDIPDSSPVYDSMASNYGDGKTVSELIRQLTSKIRELNRNIRVPRKIHRKTRLAGKIHSKTRVWRQSSKLSRTNRQILVLSMMIINHKD